MCGVFGVWSSDDISAAEVTYLGLYSLQHRGEASAGIAVHDGERTRIWKGMGLVSQVFDDDALKRLPGSSAVGHVRYAKRGSAHIANAQPLLAYSRFGQIAIAHDGSLTNTFRLRRRLLYGGALFQTTTDSEVILNWIAKSPGTSLEDSVAGTAEQLVGSYALVVLGHDRLIGLRDPMGNRPLVLGRLGNGYVLASETSAFSTIGAEPIRAVEPGEMLIIDGDGLRSRRLRTEGREAFCAFEYVYFSRPDSEIDDENVFELRKRVGRVLAEEHPIEADVVIPAPDSGIPAAMGYAEALGLPYEMGLIKNRYVGRTFIQPTDAMRQGGVRIKLSPVRKAIEGKRVVLVDDSIVRGTTTRKAIALLRETGAKEVHMVVASPPFTHTCHYGVDVPTREELIAARYELDEIRRMIGADSLSYISIEGLVRAIGRDGNRLCLACFTGDYPTPIEATDVDNLVLEERV